MNVLRARVHARMVRILRGDGLCVVQSLLLLLLMVILLMPSQAEAVIYKCVSEEGATTFSDRQCKGISRETINLRVKQPMRVPDQDQDQEQKQANTKATASSNDQVNAQRHKNEQRVTTSPQQHAAIQTSSLNDQCQFYKAELTDLRHQLSAGYSVPRKKNFQAQLKRLKDKIREVCR